jgi:hypothetical protein
VGTEHLRHAMTRYLVISLLQARIAKRQAIPDGEMLYLYMVVECAARMLSTRRVLPPRAFVKKAVPILDMVNDYLRRLVAGKVAAEDFDKVSLWVCNVRQCANFGDTDKLHSPIK